MSSPVASATAQSSEVLRFVKRLPVFNVVLTFFQDELMICDMEIESGSEETPTPPNVKPSPDGVDEVQL